MNYPDGSIVKVGDLVWWNGGCGVGQVQHIAETQKAYEAWGLDAPFVTISNEQPFDSASVTGIIYGESEFEDDGIGRLSAEEREWHDLAASRAKAMISEEHDAFCVSAVIEGGTLVGWVFEFRKSGSPVGSVTVPVR